MLNELTIAYLFLGGASAGACLVLTLLSWTVAGVGLRRPCVFSAPAGSGVSRSLWGRLRRWLCMPFTPLPEERRLLGLGYVVVVALMILGGLCLLLDVGRPDKALAFFTNTRVTVSSVGAYALSLMGMFAAFLALVWLGAVRASRAAVRIAGVVGMVVSCVVMAYTALLLEAFAGAPFWDSPWLVALFSASAVSTGIAVVVATTEATQASVRFAGLVDVLLRADVWAIAVEAVVLVAYLMSSWSVAQRAVETLLVGDLASVFWAGFVGCGLVVPAVLNVGSRKVKGLRVHPIALAILVLIGGFCLRWCVAMVPR